MPTKSERHAAIRERAADAIRNLYHNATPRYPSLATAEAELFQGWFEDAAQFEIEYLNSGGAYGTNYRKTLRAECNAGRYSTERARDYYVRWKFASMQEERARCNSLDSREAPTNAMWECITEYGKLYTYGRGGRTLAPEDLIRGHNSWCPAEDYCDEMNMADCVRLIRIVESFNAYVTSWCKSVPEMWAEHYNETAQAEDTENQPTE